MSFGVKRDQSDGGREPSRLIVKAVTTETLVTLAVVAGIFAVFIWKMGLAFTFKTAMGTAHDLILNTVLFLMGVIVLAGAFTSLMSEFGLVAVANRVLSPLMKPLFGLPGAASIGVVTTYLSDNPAIMPLGSDKGFLKYFKKWQVTTLVNLGTVFGMGLIVTTFMLAQSSQGQPLGRAVLLGNLGSVGAAVALVPQFLESGIIDAKGVCVFTAIGICQAGFLSVHVGMMDGLRERDLTSVAIATHFIGALCAGVIGHVLFLVFG